MKLMISLFLLLGLVGCSTVERSMAGKVGCPQDEIQILNSDSGWVVVNTTWVAQCRGQRFVCSSRPGSDVFRAIDDMDCTPMAEVSRGGDYEMSDARVQSFEEFVESRSSPF